MRSVIWFDVLPDGTEFEISKGYWTSASRTPGGVRRRLYIVFVKPPGKKKLGACRLDDRGEVVTWSPNKWTGVPENKAALVKALDEIPDVLKVEQVLGS